MWAPTSRSSAPASTTSSQVLSTHCSATRNACSRKSSSTMGLRVSFSRSLCASYVPNSYVEQAFFSRWWSEQTAARQADVRKLVSSGQLVFANGGYCMRAYLRVLALAACRSILFIYSADDEEGPDWLSMVDQTTLGHRLIVDAFGTAALPNVTWQIGGFERRAFPLSHSPLSTGRLPQCRQIPLDTRPCSSSSRVPQQDLGPSQLHALTSRQAIYSAAGSGWIMRLPIDHAFNVGFCGAPCQPALGVGLADEPESGNVLAVALPRASHDVQCAAAALVGHYGAQWPKRPFPSRPRMWLLSLNPPHAYTG